MAVYFYHVRHEERADEFRINVDGVDRVATIEDKETYPEEYKAEKMKRAQEPPHEPWDLRKAALDRKAIEDEVLERLRAEGKIQ